MTVLLDTHLLLWAAAGSSRFPRRVRTMLEDSDVEVVFSAASIWEIVIKLSKPRPDFDVDPRALRRQLLENGYAELEVTSAHALGVSDLPDVHRDPFDRLLIAQAKHEGFAFLTVDAPLGEYGLPVRVYR